KGKKGVTDLTQALEELPRVHLNVFIYLTHFLKMLILKGPPKDPELEEKLAVFSSVLMRPRDKSGPLEYSAVRENLSLLSIYFAEDEELLQFQ
ncbi:hypothetical protein K7432_015067, partial [Basidiobolus ranarum]